MILVYVRVAIPRSTPHALTYSIPEPYRALARPGTRARVPLRQRSVTGVVVAVENSTELDAEMVRDVEEILDPEPLLPGHLLELAHFASSYYRAPLGDTLASMLPAALLRGDADEVELTALGATADPLAFTKAQGTMLTVLQERQRLRVAALQARTGLLSLAPMAALEARGLVRRLRRRRDRPPRSEVAAVQLAALPLETMLEQCTRARKQQEVLRWMAEQGRPALVTEVCAGVGCTPSVVKALEKRDLLIRFTQASQRRARWTLGGAQESLVLTDEQQAAVEALSRAIDERAFCPILLAGVTGSGKTEVYLRGLEQALAAGRGGLVLVPEIGLTPATSGAVEQRFGEQVAVLHSAQSEGDRWREWRRIREGKARIAVGPRSALFAPLADIGLIVVDEEHDGAYKQQEAPRYHARDLALVLGQRVHAAVLLCSATPSSESLALVERGRAQPLSLTRRVAGGSLPQVDLVDLRGEPPEPGEQGRTLFSRRLRELMSQTLARGEQAILLMQRRGWAPVLLCRDCGHRVECPSCSVSLVVHRRSNDMRCHYCGHRQHHLERCPSCAGTLLDAVGAGTEKVAHHFQRHFPETTSVILDRDTVRRRSGLEGSLGAFASGQAQVLIGTQMVAKGHHFPDVTLTGVISADALLSLPDYRAGERTFQLLTQVAGRAGRGPKPGRVVIQTYYPEHPAVRCARQHDVTTFITEELLLRRAFHYPPAARMALARFRSTSERRAREAAEAAARTARSTVDGPRVRGPAPAPIERVRNQWRWQVLLTAASRPPPVRSPRSYRGAEPGEGRTPGHRRGSGLDLVTLAIRQRAPSPTPTR